MQIIIWIVLAFPLLFVLPKNSYRWTMPGKFALALSFPVVLGWWAYSGAGIYVSPNVGVAAVLTVAVLTVATILSPLPYLALMQLIIFVSAVFLGLAFANHNVFPVIVFAGVVHAVSVFLPASRLIRSSAPGGIAGNSNYAGAFLAPCVFIALHNGWPPAVPVLFVALILTKCRGAFLGMVAGLFFVAPIMAGVLIICGIPLFLRLKKNAPESLVARMSVWRGAIRFLTVKRFLIGMGGNVGRIVFMRDLNIKPEWRMRILHSDILQGLYDGGVFYVSIYLAIGISSTVTAYHAGSPMLAAAVTSIMVAGLFLDTRLLTLTSIVFWVLIGQINVAPVPAVTVSVWLLPVAGLLLILVGQTWGRAFVADLFYGIGFWKNNRDLMAIAHRVNPQDQLILSEIVGALINVQENEPAFFKAMQLADTYDGEVEAEVVSFLLAVTSFNVGAYRISRKQAIKTIEYNAAHIGARDLIKAIDERLQKSIH